MAKIRRVIRKLKPASLNAFDEQLWPVNMALLVLTGFVAGVILVIFRGTDGLFPILRWTSLAILVATVALSMWALRHVDHRFIQRGLQLSLVLSLIFHLVVLVLMAVWRPVSSDTGEATPLAENHSERRQITIPEYELSQLVPTPQQRPDILRPIETETPETRPDEVPRKIEDPMQTEPQPTPSPVPEASVHVQPSTIARRQPSDAPPRKAPNQSRLSRTQNTQVKPSPAQQVQAPRVASSNPETTERQPQRSAVQRQVSAEQSPQRTSRETPRTQTRRTKSQAARRQVQQEPKPRSSSAPTVPRTVAQPNRLPRTRVATNEQPASPRETTSSALTPETTAVKRQLTAAPESSQTPTKPTPITTTQVAEQVIRQQQPSQSNPELARTPQSVPDRRARASAQPNATEVVAAETPTSSPATSNATHLQPSTSSIARATVQAPDAAQTPQSTPTPAASPRVQVGRVPPARAEVANAPTIAPELTPSDTPQRTTRRSQMAASPVQISSPASAQSPHENQPSLEPMRTALTRGTRGTAGIGTAPNLDRATPSTRRPSQVASASARRTRSTQAIQAGPALSPSEPARISRSRAGAQTPSATLRTQNVEVATAAGAAQPASLEASSSAAVTRAASNAQEGAVTASRGTVDVDIGPQRVVSNNASGRAAGGGQPTLNFDTKSASEPRTRGGGAPSASILAADMADVPAAPAGDGGGHPTSLQPQAVALAAVRAQPDGDLPVSGGPSSVDETGAPTPRGNAPQIAAARIGRADTVEATRGPAEAGGGTVSPMRQSSGPPPVTNTRADEIAMNVTPPSSGAPVGEPLDAEGSQLARDPGGILESAILQPVGALASDETMDVSATGPVGADIGLRRDPPQDEPAPMLADAGQLGPPLQRDVSTELPTGTRVDVEAPESDHSPSPDELSPSVEQLAGGMGASVSIRQTFAAGSLAVEAPAEEGPGGIGAEFEPHAGSISRRASIESDEIHLREVRFLQERAGGAPSANAVARVAAPGFANRLSRKEGDRSGGLYGRPSVKTEVAIELGLVFLARHQSDDGSWSLHNYAAGKPYQDQIHETAALHSDTAGTALSLLAYLGAGYHHQDDKFQDVVRDGLDHLIRNKQEDGNLFIPEDNKSNGSVALYSHAIATIALCEAYGMTLDPMLHEPTQQAIDYIVQTQNTELGGWRYQPTRSSDTSVTGWMMMALKSAQLAKLNVPQKTMDGIDQWLTLAQTSESRSYKFIYNPYATARQEHGRRPSRTMTSVGLLMRLYSGWRRDDEKMIWGAEYLLENVPSMRERDTYYWYYATQVMFHMGGEYWETWQDNLYPMLRDTQVQDGPLAGSWNPRYPVRDRWGSHAGRLYVTTMNLLSLEVHYRHLPLYDDTAP